MTTNKLQTELQQNTYYEYAKRYDEQNDTNHAELIEMFTKRRIQRESNEPQQITADGKRNVVGNYSNNNVMIEKTLTHLNSLKRSMSLSFQSDDENTRLLHENNMFRELLNLELSLRTMKTNIKRDEQNNK